ncbi:MAG: transcriptional regulator [Paracoccus denitrificans]|uniref:Transcriptional regulator n=1 Tax=Paracoccus denitrificans TaxID=266 RepID=A0A533I2B1_PARDE|nr:MAG: transcriptional regulator [Paracoccus denitrificans]
MPASKPLTAEQFARAIDGMTISERPTAMARAVLVDGMSQSDCARAMNVSRNAVSLAVNRVRDAHEAVPAGFERVTAILPSHQASVVKGWHERAPLKGEIAR